MVPTEDRLTQLWTYQDAVEHVLDHLDMDADGRTRRQARRAVQQAIRDLAHRHNWACYYGRATVPTTAQQTSSTIEYDHTGGTYERQVTLASGTWPSDAAQGMLIISGVHYAVDERKSSTVLTLRPDNNPGADVAAGTSYTWYRSTYALPVDFRKVERLWWPSQSMELYPLSQGEAHAELMASWPTPGNPIGYTIRQTQDFYNTMSLVMSPPPSTAVTLDLFYQRNPRELRVEKYATGTVTTNASTTVTGSGTSWSSSHVGCVMRFSSSTTVEPTGVVGGLSGDDNPAVYTRIVTAVGSTTSITVDSSVPALTGVKYTLSDPLDMHYGSMLTVFHRFAEAEAARLLNRDDRDRKLAIADRELLRAIEADLRIDRRQMSLVNYAPWWKRGTVPTAV